jgi:hypothetical protein
LRYFKSRIVDSNLSADGLRKVIENKLDELFERVARGTIAGKKLERELRALARLGKDSSLFLEMIAEALSCAKRAFIGKATRKESLRAIAKLKQSLHRAKAAAAQVRIHEQAPRWIS